MEILGFRSPPFEAVVHFNVGVEEREDTVKDDVVMLGLLLTAELYAGVIGREAFVLEAFHSTVEGPEVDGHLESFEEIILKIDAEGAPRPVCGVDKKLVVGRQAECAGAIFCSSGRKSTYFNESSDGFGVVLLRGIHHGCPAGVGCGV